jgi:hypothetical protein
MGDEQARIRIERLTIVEPNAATAIFEIDYDDARIDLTGLSVQAPRENWGDDPERVLSLVRLTR